jgi:transglutaminase-like putative cysteine protease
MVSPRADHGDQRRLSRKLTIEPSTPLETAEDVHGNDVVTLRAPYVDRAIDIAFESMVSRRVESSEHTILPKTLLNPGYRKPSALTQAGLEISDAAAFLRSRYARDRDLAEAIVDFVYDEIVYTKGVTDVSTTAVDAFFMRRGVCQDYAHVALSIARACGISARYVSGHLLGEGATHAWVEFLFPADGGGGISVSFDPTYGAATTIRYVVIAVGRDYADVAPTSGTYTAPYAGTLEARTNVSVVSVSHR